MTTTTITRIYSNYDQAAGVVAALESAGFPARDITLLSNSQQHAGLSPYTAQTSDETPESEDTYDTAVTTGGLGAGVGLLTGLGLIAIPGLGPIAAVGWLGATLAGFAFGSVGGATIGAISESLAKHGVDQETAVRNANAVSAGKTLVAVRCDSAKVSAAESILGTTDEVLNTNMNAASTSRVA